MSTSQQDKESTVGGLAWTYVIDQCTVIIDAEPALRVRGAAIHDTRVAARRFRSTLRVFGDLFDAERAGSVTEELRWYAGVLGTVRDLDVLEARLLAQVDDLPAELVLGPVRRQIAEELQLRRNQGWNEIAEALDSERYRQLIAEVRRWRSDPPLTAAAAEPEKVVKTYVKRANKKVEKRLAEAVEAWGSRSEEADALLHRARKAGKRHRYAVELALPVLGEKGERKVAARKGLQDVLGDHQDAVGSVAFLRGEGARLGIRSGHNGFTYGLLCAREMDFQDGLLDRLPPG